MCRKRRRNLSQLLPADRSAGPAFLALFLALFLAVAPISGVGVAFAAQDGAALPLRSEVQQRLGALQIDWLEWLTATQGADAARADAAVNNLLRRAREAGFERLPDLSIAASARAVEFAQDGDMAAAAESLRAAERLDPGRPEAALATATISRLDGSPLNAAVWHLRGLGRTVRVPQIRHVLLSNFLVWALNALALASLAYIGLQMTTRGQLLYRDLFHMLAKSLPVPVAHGLTLAILLWPALLPAGLLWIALFWSLLLWGYGTRSERVIMICVWVFLGALPLLVSEQARRTGLLLTRPARAIENIAAGRLAGNLFTDVEVLATLLPDSVAAKHLAADLHLSLRQWERAESLYHEVLAAEPNNTAALTDLGTGYFYRADLRRAISTLEQAVAGQNAQAEAFFNLSRAYAENLQFAEQAPMIQRASAMAGDAVREWLAMETSEQVIAARGGIARGAEIRRELSKVWRASEADPSLITPWRRILSLPLALVFALPALALYVVKRRSRYRSRRLEIRWWEDPLERARRVLLPGVPETESGRPFRGFLALLVLVVLLTAPLRSLVGYALPLGYSAGSSLLGWLALVGLVVFLALRYMRWGSVRAGDGAGAGGKG